MQISEQAFLRLPNGENIIWEKVKYKSVYKVIGIILYYFRYSKTQFGIIKKLISINLRDYVNN